MTRQKPEVALKKAIKEAIPDAHWQSIESWSIGGGIPDLNGCLKGVEVWIETKIWPRKLTPKQANWLAKRYEAGGNTFFIMQREKSIKVWKGWRARNLMHTGWGKPDPEINLTLPISNDGAALLRRALFGRNV